MCFNEVKTGQFFRLKKYGLYINRFFVWVSWACVVFGHNCHITARAIIQFTSYFSDLSFFQLAAQGGFLENPVGCVSTSSLLWFKW